MAPARLRGWTSSLIYAIAIDGTPARTTPCRARRAISTQKFGLNAGNMHRTDAAIMEIIMIFLRPSDSEMEPKTSMLTARANVVTVMDRLDSVALTPKTSVNIGMSGCAV